MKYLKYIVSFLISFAILLIIFSLQDLYPFGINSIVQVDADYQYIPVLYRIFDFLHGNFIINYTGIGLGNNSFISMIIQGSFFSPINLLLYFTSRDNIVNYFNIVVMIKICLISLTSYIFINKTFKVNEFYKILFSILYAFSGWVLLNYFNYMWLDSVILFPLIIMFLNSLLYKKEYVGYVITLSLSLIISYYISYFILLFILFYSFIIIFYYIEKNQVKKVIFRLGICTGIALLIASFSLFPALYQMIISSRFSTDSSCGLISDLMNKSLYLIMSPIILIMFGALITKYKNDKKKIYCYILLLLLFTVGIIIEPINLALHGGSYWSFPYRYSFIPLFIMMSGGLHFVELHKEYNSTKIYIIQVIAVILLSIMSIFLNLKYLDEIRDSLIVLSFDNAKIFEYIVLILSMISLATILSILFENKYIKYICLSIVFIIQIFVISSWTMFYSEGYFLTKESNKINNNISFDNNKINRYKMDYKNYTPCYGLIYDVGTIDNWLHILPNGQVNTYKDLGYETNDSSVRSYGGTIFTDWLFNTKYLLSTKLYDDKLLNLITTYDDYKLYEYTYKSNFGFKYDNNETVNKSDNPFIFQNNIYKNLFNTDEDIIKIHKEESENTYEIDLNYNTNEKVLAYIYFNNNYDNVEFVEINNQKIYDYDDFIKYLGIYDDKIKITVHYNTKVEYALLNVGFINYNDIINMPNVNIKISNNSNKYYIETSSEFETERLFLPINNIPGLKAILNGKEIKIDTYIDNFVSIKLDKGVNKIEIKYEMPYFRLGIIISFLGLVALFLMKYIKPGKVILNITYCLYMVIIIFAYVYYYGYSLIKYLL